MGGKKFINKKTCAEFFISQLIRYKIPDKSNLLLICLVLSGLVMDNGYSIRTKNQKPLKWLAFWACQSAAQTKSIYVEKNVAESKAL